jgi:hypothetical protein
MMIVYSVLISCYVDFVIVYIILDALVVVFVGFPSCMSVSSQKHVPCTSLYLYVMLT